MYRNASADNIEMMPISVSVSLSIVIVNAFLIKLKIGIYRRRNVHVKTTQQTNATFNGIKHRVAALAALYYCIICGQEL